MKPHARFFMIAAFRPRSARVVVCFGLFVSTIACRLPAAQPAWKPVRPEELAETTPRIEPAAPAEVLFLNIEIDDREYPFQRKTTTYVRYKIFDTDKVDQITRVSNVTFTGSQDRTEIRARLISPNGEVREFGQEAVMERPLVQRATQGGFLGWLVGTGAEAKERFLAITGVERGAVLEFHTTEYDRFPGPVTVTIGQREHFPVREFEYRARVKKDKDYLNTIYMSNAQNAKTSGDPKTNSAIVKATNLPAVTPEPFAGPLTDQMLTVFNCYEPANFTVSPRSKVPLPAKIVAKDGPWAPYATLMDWAARDRSVATKQSTKLAAEITQAGKTEVEKARLIHRWVDREWQGFRAKRGTKPRTREPRNIDDVIDWQKADDVILKAEEFLWLALSLYRSAGLTAHLVLLPNRELARFKPESVSPVFLPHLAIALRIDEAWHFSSPHHTYSLPFNMLPWQQEGQGGLLAQNKKQEFIPVPVSPAQRSLVGTSGVLQLDADGTVHGEFVRRFTGQSAALLRGTLRDKAEADRPNLIKKRLGLDLKAAELTVTKIEGVEDPEAPLEVTCQLRWASFAVRTKDRLIVRPLVLRAEAVTPFPAEQRRSWVYFPRRWQEIDELKLVLPKDYELESPTAPVAAAGEVIHYRVAYGVDEQEHFLQVRREFMSNIVGVGVEHYDGLRKFYDHVVRSDQHELVLRRKGAVTAQ